MYVKYHDSWDETDKLSAQALNHIGTQYDELYTIFAAHNHDTTHYTKTLADSTFFHSTFMGLDSGFDAEYLDGESFEDLTGNALPIGSIMWWGGYDGDVPLGWHICNGQAGTQDLRDKFIIGSGDTYSIGDTGGSFTTELSGTITVEDHELVGDEIPLHTHGFIDRWNGTGSSSVLASASGAMGSFNYESRTTGSAGGNGGHGHTGNSITFEDLDVTPAFYALYLIQRVS